MANSSKKIALVTGANKGIGFEVARQLGRNGCTVFVGARNLALGREASAQLQKQSLDARFVELDVTRRDTVEAAAALIQKDFGRLDILVNNAGIVDPADGPPSAASLDAVERVFQANFFGALSVAQVMLPLLRKSAAGRIVNVSSGLGSLAFNADPQWQNVSYTLIGYCASKAAMNMLTVQLAYELRHTPIKVNSAAPGYTSTDMNQHRGTQTLEQGAAETVRLSLLPSDGPSGSFSSSEGPKPW
ncbi:MAG TPA: SDR family oxidoreductase [Verrucomicrobiae bacterium]|nr:SDR family oxidoreductase [Verrucomicrobiae bacterium]